MKIKKIYTTTPTLCKNGVTKPITRVHLETDCDECGGIMILEKHIKGSFHKRAWKRWRCTDMACNYAKVEEGEKDMYIRMGVYDEEVFKNI